LNLLWIFFAGCLSESPLAIQHIPIKNNQHNQQALLDNLEGIGSNCMILKDYIF